MQGVTTAQGIVLKKYTLLEMSQSCTIFSRQYGKVHLLARGIQKWGSRRASHLQTGNLISAVVTRSGNDSWYVRSTDLVSAFSSLKEDGQKVKVLYNMLLVLDRLLPLGQPDELVYDRLLRAIVHLSSKNTQHDSVLFGFVSELFDMLGYGHTAIASYDEVVTILSQVAEERVRLFV